VELGRDKRASATTSSAPRTPSEAEAAPRDDTSRSCLANQSLLFSLFVVGHFTNPPGAIAYYAVLRQESLVLHFFFLSRPVLHLLNCINGSISLKRGYGKSIKSSYPNIM
jgi:hypothetical protein